MSTTPTALATLYPHGMESLPQGLSIHDILNRLGADTTPNPPPNNLITTEPLTQPSAFVKPLSIYFHLDGNKRRWDAVQSHASVAVLLYHTTKKAFILVRQFRPAVYATALRVAKEVEEEGGDSSSVAVVVPATAGFTFELCAGIVDKRGLSLAEIAHEEILEETGYFVPVEKIKKVTSFLSAVGISGSRQTIFAAKLDDSMLADKQDGVGGGLAHHGEAIEVVALPATAVDAFLMDESLGKSAGMMFALTLATKHGGIFSSV